MQIQGTARQLLSTQAAADGKPCEPIVATLAVLALDALIVILRLAPLAQQVSQQRAAHLTAPEQSAADQQPREFMVTVRAFLAHGLFALVAVVLRLAALVMQVCQQRAAHLAAPEQSAADQQPCEPIVAALVVLALDALIVILCLAPLAQQMSQQRAAHLAAPE